MVKKIKKLPVKFDNMGIYEAMKCICSGIIFSGMPFTEETIDLISISLSDYLSCRLEKKYDVKFKINQTVDLYEIIPNNNNAKELFSILKLTN